MIPSAPFRLGDHRPIEVDSKMAGHLQPEKVEVFGMADLLELVRFMALNEVGHETLERWLIFQLIPILGTLT